MVVGVGTGARVGECGLCVGKVGYSQKSMPEQGPPMSKTMWNIFCCRNSSTLDQWGGYSVMQRSGAGERQTGRYAPLSNHAPLLCEDDLRSHARGSPCNLSDAGISKKVCKTWGAGCNFLHFVSDLG